MLLLPFVVASMIVSQPPSTATDGAATAVQCRELTIQVKLTPTALTKKSIFAKMCSLGGQPTPTVQFLVHGGTYSHIYWDFPVDNERYSYLKYAAARGYTTLAIDRIGSGKSSHPFSTQVDLSVNAYIVHQIVQRLRSDGLGTEPFEKVVLVGHSYGTFTSWLEASKYKDVDGVIGTGAMHLLNPVGAATIALYLSKPAFLEPRFSHLDPGYITTHTNTREPFFYFSPNADPAVIAMDEATKETITATELLTFPGTTILGTTKGIKAPYFNVIGQHDGIFCGIGAADCNDVEAVQAQEAPYYSPEACLESYVLPNSGHDVNLQLNAQEWFAAGVEWVDQMIGRGSRPAPGCSAG